jgi:ZIP family zinc transporter
MVLISVLELLPEATAVDGLCAVGAALVLALHLVIPHQEFAMALPAATLRSRHTLFGAAPLSALAEPLGAVVGLAVVEAVPSLNASFLAFAAGAMLFVSIHELVPMARRYGHGGTFAWGVALSALAYWLLARMAGPSGGPS